MSILKTRAKRVDLQNRPKIHTDAEVERAVAGLTRADLKRLRAIARTIFSSLSLPAADRGPDDLVSEALARTLNRSRGWRKQVDFLYHLSQSMRSIAWKWREREDEKARAVTTLSLDELPGGDAAALPDTLTSRSSDPQATTIRRDLLRQIQRAFADDPAARAVLDSWAQGCKGPEIRRRHGLTEKELRAAIRRIRRFAISLRDTPRGEDHGH